MVDRRSLEVGKSSWISSVARLHAPMFNSRYHSGDSAVEGCMRFAEECPDFDAAGDRAER